MRRSPTVRFLLMCAVTTAGCALAGIAVLLVFYVFFIAAPFLLGVGIWLLAQPADRAGRPGPPGGPEPVRRHRQLTAIRTCPPPTDPARPRCRPTAPPWRDARRAG